MDQNAWNRKKVGRGGGRVPFICKIMGICGDTKESLMWRLLWMYGGPKTIVEDFFVDFSCVNWRLKTESRLEGEKYSFLNSWWTKKFLKSFRASCLKAFSLLLKCKVEADMASSKLKALNYPENILFQFSNNGSFSIPVCAASKGFHFSGIYCVEKFWDKPKRCPFPN